MRKQIFFFVSIVMGLSVSAQFDARKTPLLTKSLSSDNVKSVIAETSGGSITVTGVEASEAKIEVYVVPNNYKENNFTEAEIRQKMEAEYNLTVSVSNGKLTATAEHKEKNKNIDWKKALNFSFKIFVPKNVSTDLHTSGGSISLSNLSGTQEFGTSGGSLHVDNVSGKVNGRTSGGTIHLEDSKDDIDLSTSGGSIHAKNCEGKLRLSTSGGSLNLSYLKGDIKATTSGGSVNGSDISGDLIATTSGGSVMLNKMSCNLETSTSGGSIHIEMKELRNYVTVSNSAGYVDVIVPSGKGLDLKLSGDRIKTDRLESFNGTVEDDQITGKLNGGGTKVTVKGNGRVYLGFAKNIQ